MVQADEDQGRQADAVDLSAMRGLVGFNIRILDVLFSRLSANRFQHHGLTLAEATVLVVIDANPGIRQGELSDALLVQRPNMTKLIKRLEAEGLIRRVASLEDKRHVRLVASQAGRRAADEIRSRNSEQDLEVNAALSSAEREQLNALLGRLIAALAPRLPQPDEDGENIGTE